MGGVVSHLTFFVKHFFSCDFYNFTLRLNESSPQRSKGMAG